MAVEVSAYAKYAAEFIGTFLLVFTVGCNVLTGSAVWAATSIACVLMVSIYALGGVSGANFNPAVSLTLGLCGKLEWMEVGIYCAVQLLAGIMAGLTYALTLGEVFNLMPSKGGDHWYHAGLAELCYTFMLCFVVLNVAASTAHAGKNQFYGLAIGFVIVAGGYGAGHISGGCFNPAVAFGIDVSSAGLGFGWCLAYTVFEVLGAALAAGLFRVCRPEDFGGDISNGYPMSSKLTSEFLGTFMLVLTVGLNVIGGSPAPVWSIAAALMCMIFALGSCSGAHFNPAVTCAIVLAGRDKIELPVAGLYVVAQLFGGITAAFMYALLEDGKTFPLAPGANFGWVSAGLAEIAFTFLLCFVVLSVATVKSEKVLSEYFGLAIGSCVTAGGYAIGAVSGGSLNPAVSVGISTADLHLNPLYHGTWMNCIGYSLAEFAGAILAAVVFRVTHTAEYPEELEKKASA
eukprot:gnl/TRDRNA2_/TRDRNA2_174230_c4_seq15.p1 gnl/TRDRNA2_/TRDRNA2_174230_c4~~gnl/TRDRNA2_/TRDRNA2_174230_c4_seq15.p1  ORF type:complete len:459 (-),score=93.77 gnl/TRDRNA2_/TRDRNA2_174230_c4_seq15:68-1444(-)